MSARSRARPSGGPGSSSTNGRPALEEAGDLIIPLRQKLIDEGHILAEIGEVLAGLKPGRSSDDEITVFKSVGNAVLDLAVASLVVG